MGSRSDATSVRSVAGWWHSPTATRNALVVLLAIAAGFSDALGYVGLGRVFTANMTGNTILLGLAIGQGEVAAAGRSVAALVGFILGILVAGMIVACTRDRSIWSMTVTATLAGECLVLLVFTLWGTIASPSAASWANDALIVGLAMAMGMQSITLHVLGISGFVSTAITSTWIEVICGLSGRFRMIRELQQRAAAAGNYLAGIRVQVMVIGAYLVAAVAAGMAYSRWQLAVAAIPTGVVAFVTIVAFLRFQRSSS
jgi:uncharacterized membrane protein YoaK (UPF0700 family)